nr:uncharacterized protein LOC128687385 [Cherax quadricarinatus]
MRRTIVRTQEELDEIEDNKWRRKSYALAQNNALPVPMPLPVYPLPKPCIPPVGPRPLRTGPRPPPNVYRPSAGFRPSAAHRQSRVSNSVPAKSEALPTLSEASGFTPEIVPRRISNNNSKQFHTPPQEASLEQPTAQLIQSPMKTSAGPTFSTFLPANPAAPSPKSTNSKIGPVKETPSSRGPVRAAPPPPKTPPASAPLAMPRKAHGPKKPNTRPPPIPQNTPVELNNFPQPKTQLPPDHINGPTLPAKALQISTETFPTQVSLPLEKLNPKADQENLRPIQTNSFLEQVNPRPAQTILSSPKTNPPSKSENPLPKQGDILSQTAPSPKQTDPPLINANHPPEQINPSLIQVTPVLSENAPTLRKTSSSPKEIKSPPKQTNPSSPQRPNPQPEDPLPPNINSTLPLTPTSTPPQPNSKLIPTPTSTLSHTTNNLPPTPTSERLPPTPTSQSRSPTPTSFGSPGTPSSLSCPRTPTSIRAAPWQPYFPPTPLSRTPRATPTPTSWTPATSPTPSSRTAETSSGALPASSNNHLLPPTPPSSSYHVGGGSITPSSSMSSLNHVTGQSKTMDEDEEQFTKDIVDSSSLPYPAVLDVSSLHTDVKVKVTMFSSTTELNTEPNNTGAEPQEDTYRTYWTRFWILAVFSFVALLQTTVWGTFGPIAESALVAFPSWTDSTIAAFPNWGPIIVVLFTIPMMWITQKLGLRLAVLTCTLLLTLGTVLRCFTSQETPFTVICHISSILFAFAACMTLSLPAMIAAVWFPPNERITATAVGALMCQLGGAAMYMGPLIVASPSRKDNVTIAEADDIRGDIMVLMYIHFGAAALLLLVAIVYFPSSPPTPPSASSAKERIDFFSGIRNIIKNLPLLLVLLTYAFSFGIPVVWIGVLNLSLIDINIYQEQAMGVAVTAVSCSSVAAFITARITDKVYGHLRVTIMGFLVLSSIFFLWFLLLTTEVIVPSLAQVYVAVAGGVSFEYATVPLLVELAVEIGYPIPESVTGAMLTFTFNLVALVFLGLFQIPIVNHLWVSYVLFGCVSLTVLPLLFVKETHKRSDTDRKHIQ